MLSFHTVVGFPHIFVPDFQFNSIDSARIYLEWWLFFYVCCGLCHGPDRAYCGEFFFHTSCVLSRLLVSSTRAAQGVTWWTCKQWGRHASCEVLPTRFPTPDFSYLAFPSLSTALTKSSARAGRVHLRCAICFPTGTYLSLDFRSVGSSANSFKKVSVFYFRSENNAPSNSLHLRTERLVIHSS